MVKGLLEIMSTKGKTRAAKIMILMPMEDRREISPQKQWGGTKRETKAPSGGEREYHEHRRDKKSQRL